MISIDLILTAASTGTVGNTLTTNPSGLTTLGYSIIGIITLLFIIGHLLDRKYSYQELK